MFPLITNAQFYTLPSGMELWVENHSSHKMVMKEFTLPSGLKIEAPQLVEHREFDEFYVSNSLVSPLKWEIIQYATRAALEGNISPNKLIDIINCESRFNPKAINLKDTDGHPKYGLLQFDTRTFTGKDIWDWREQIDVAVKLMSKDGFGRWPVCSKS